MIYPEPSGEDVRAQLIETALELVVLCDSLGESIAGTYITHAIDILQRQAGSAPTV